MSILKNYIYGIRRYTYHIDIDAPAERVWYVLLNDETYRQWTKYFHDGSYYKGELKQGGRVHFLTPEGGGMYADIIIYKPYSNILFQHIGEVVNFVEQPLDETAERWTGAFENYILKSSGSITKLIVEVDITPEHVTFLNENFSKGLKKIKELSELS